MVLHRGAWRRAVSTSHDSGRPHVFEGRAKRWKDVVRQVSTMSRDIRLVPGGGIEPPSQAPGPCLAVRRPRITSSARRPPSDYAGSAEDPAAWPRYRGGPLTTIDPATAAARASACPMPGERGDRGTAPADDGADGPASRNPSMAAATSGCRDDARLQVVEHRVAEGSTSPVSSAAISTPGSGPVAGSASPPCVCLAAARGKGRFQHPPRRCCVHGYEPVPRPLASTGSPASMAGTSEPSPRPTAAMWFRVAVGCQSSPRASSVAAASALPPASPAATGTRLSREIATDGGTPRREASARPLARRGSARRAFLRARRGRRSPRGPLRTLDASDRDHVVERDREHERLDVVEPVLARAEHPQEDALIFA